MRGVLGVVVVIAACHGMREAHGGPTDPATRGKTLIDAEVASLKSGNAKALFALFDPDAVLLAATPKKVSGDELIANLGDLTPHGTIKAVKVVKLVAGGDDKVVWVMADLAITKLNQEPQFPATTKTVSIHTTQLLAADAGWKVVAVTAAESHEAERSRDVLPMKGTTGDVGPLAALAAAPDKLAAALAADPNVVVVGNEKEYAVGAGAAKKLLATWGSRKLSVNGKVREVHKDNYGFVQANVDWEEPGGKPYRFMAQVIALPKADGSWSVVAAQYLAL